MLPFFENQLKIVSKKVSSSPKFWKSFDLNEPFMDLEQHFRCYVNLKNFPLFVPSVSASRLVSRRSSFNISTRSFERFNEHTFVNANHIKRRLEEQWMIQNLRINGKITFTLQKRKIICILLFVYFGFEFFK